MNSKYGEDLAFWINLGDRSLALTDYDAVMKASKGRSLLTLGDYSAHTGLNYTPEVLPSHMTRGYVGYKIWCGPWYRRLKEDEAG